MEKQKYWKLTLFYTAIGALALIPILFEWSVLSDYVSIPEEWNINDEAAGCTNAKSQIGPLLSVQYQFTASFVIMASGTNLFRR